MMVRPIQYNREEVLDNALQVFWQQGYGGSSVDKLVEATALNKHSLYRAFDGKEGLFLSCLERYIEVQSKSFFQILAERKGIDAIQDYFKALQKQAGTGPGSACLVANTASEIGAEKELVQTIIDRYYKRLATAFSRAVEQGQALKQIKPNVDIKATAEYLVYVAQGITLSSRYKRVSSRGANAVISLLATAET